MIIDYRQKAIIAFFVGLFVILTNLELCLGLHSSCRQLFSRLDQELGRLRHSLKLSEYSEIYNC